MIFFYSGSCGALRGGALVGEPENALKGATVMLSYFLIANKMQEQHRRLPPLTGGKAVRVKARA